MNFFSNFVFTQPQFSFVNWLIFNSHNTLKALRQTVL